MERQRHLRRGELFDVLSRERRRDALRALSESGGPVALDELARAVAARERGVSPAELDGDHVERVRVSLYHCHVPKLAEAGLVSHRDEAGTVAPTARLDLVVGDAGLRVQDGESNVTGPQ